LPILRRTTHPLKLAFPNRELIPGGAPVRRKLFRLIFAPVGLLAVLALGAAAQTSSINGTVLDATGAVVPGAKVTVQDAGRSTSRTVTSSAAGVYSVPNLPPATYDVTIERDGFRSQQFAAVKLTVDQALTLDARLEVSSAAQSVTVTGSDIAPINTTDAQVSTVIEQQQIQELPLILRDPYQLILLSPGSTNTNSGLGGFSINGARERNNNFQLDGEDNNDSGVPAGGLTTLNPDNVQEFRVISDNYLPEYGRNSGSVIDIVTRSGGDKFNGDVYYFGRWNGFGGARDFFNNLGSPQDPYVRNTFGASLGGPIRKGNKGDPLGRHHQAYFFFNYEGNRFATTLTNSAVVPDPHFLTGVFTVANQGNSGPATATIDVSHAGVGNNATPLSLDPLVQHILGTYPVSTLTRVAGLTDTAFFASPDLLNADNYTARVDFNVTEATTLSLRYLANHSNESNQSHLDTLPGIGGVSATGLNQNWAARLDTAISSSMINTFKFGALRANEGFGCTGVDKVDALGPVDIYGRGRDYGFPTLPTPTLAIDGCFALGDTDAQHRWFGTYNMGDDLTWIKGRHTTKFGIQFSLEYTQDFDGFTSRSQPNFAVFSQGTGDSALTGLPVGFEPGPEVEDMVWVLLGALNNEAQSQFFNLSRVRQPNDLRHFREHDFAWFWQDQMKVRPNFTFNFGLRYEWTGTPYEENNLLTQVTLAQATGPAPITFYTTSRGGPQSLYKNDPWGFEPRIGFAWDPFKTGKTSVRAGYGIVRDRLFFNLVGNARGNPPLDNTFFNNAFANNGATPSDQIANTPIPGTIATSAEVDDGAGIFPAQIDPNLHVAFVQDWNFGIQHDLGRNTVAEVNYVGSKSNRLLRVVDGNPTIPSLVAALRTFCQNPANPNQCVDGPDASDVQGQNLYFGAETINPATGLPVLPFDAANNNAFFHSNLTKSVAFSAYNGLQASITRHSAKGLFFGVSYTWAHAVDDSGDPLAPQASTQVFPASSFDLRQERGNSSFDVRNRFVANYGLPLPLGRGAQYLREGFAGRLLEGWIVSGITTLQSGFPFDVITLRDSQGTGSIQRADFDPSLPLAPLPAGVSAITQTGPNAGLFVPPPFGSGGNSGRNHFRGPGIDQWNFVIVKNTSFKERYTVELRTEFYNIFNHPDFIQPDNLIEDGPGAFGQSFGEVQQNDSTTGARQVQVGLKFLF
jgi:hypothetical protein